MIKGIGNFLKRINKRLNDLNFVWFMCFMLVASFVSGFYHSSMIVLAEKASYSLFSVKASPFASEQIAGLPFTISLIVYAFIGPRNKKSEDESKHSKI